MKIFLKIITGILLLLVVVAVGISLYFTNERLQNMVMPKVNDAVGRQVQVESMSITFFSTFPQPGVSIENMSISGDTEQDTLLALDELVAGVHLFSLFGDEIKMSEIQLNHPRFTYRVNSDSTTNIDFLLAGETREDTTAEGYAIDIPYFEINNGQFGYVDQTSATNIRLQDLNANISVRYADLINSTLDVEVGGLYAKIDSSNYVNGLPISLTEKSTLNLKDETVSLEEGTFSIRGLALNLSGNISNWSTTPTVNLALNSSSDDFGELLLLMPKKYTEDLETKGSLALKGTVKGAVGGEQLPAFDLSAKVTDGYIKNPDLPQPIEDIQLTAQASNDLLEVKTLTAHAGENNISGNGRLSNPLEENGAFSLDMKGDINLTTINNFYDINQFDLEQLNGKLNLDVQAKGDRNKPKEATFNGIAQWANGSLKFKDVQKPIENISVDIKGDQSKVTINNMQLQAASNTFSMKGAINQPLDENQRAIDLNANLKFDLATIKDFYPISEDTLTMRGMLTANASLRGKADQIENAVQKGSLNLKNGFIDYKNIAKPIEDLTLVSTLDGPTMKISSARFKTGDNNLSASGTITNYLSDNRSINLKVTGNADLAQIQDYYDLKPSVTTLNGKADLNLNASGPVAKPADMKFDGQMTVKEMNMEGEAIVQPVKK